jgi:hypothetical protein
MIPIGSSRSLCARRLRIVPFSAILAALFTIAGVARAEVEFRPQGQGYRVVFPGQPKVRAEDVRTRFGPSGVVTVEWARPAGGSCYLVHTRYLGSTVPEGPQKALERVRFGRLVKGVLRSQKRFEFEGHPAQQDVVDTTLPGRPVIVSLDAVRGADIFSVYCIVDRGQEAATDVQEFIGSFTLSPP